jgi:arylsulfatase A-like enzyme
VEKFDNAYEESIRIPLIVSNPKLHVWGQASHSLISVLDILSTVADLLGVSGALESCFYGTSLLVEVLDNPRMCPNEMVHFTYNDIPSRNAPSIIRCVRTLRYKYAVYFTSDGNDTDWELYNLQSGSG